MAGAGGSPTPFVGRDDELEVLAAALAADVGAPGLVRVSGEAGVGKSRLVAETIDRAARRALIGYSSPGSLGRPFDLLRSAVEPAVRGWADVPPALGGIRTALCELLRGVAPGLDGATPDQPVSPVDLISAGIALVRHLDVDVIVLEDLHWADVESLQVAERVLAAPEHPLVVVTYRTEDLDGRNAAADLVTTMAARRTSRHLHLDPFGPDEIDRLLTEWTGESPSATVVDRLRSRTGGNAFYLEEILTSTDGWDRPLDDTGQFPETLTETIRLRLKGLTTDERDTLATAAILGSPFEFDLLATALDVDEAELIDRLRTLIDRRLVIEPEVDVFRFRHELVRESVLASLLGRERRRLHDRAWTATLEHCPAAYAELARHAAGSERIDELARLAPKGIRHYLARGSTRQALVLAELALEHRPDDAELRELAARSAWLTGRNEIARRHALRWQAAAASGDGYGVDALALLARIAYESDDPATQATIVDDMECLLPNIVAPVERARVLTELAQQHMLMDASERAIECATEARVLATEHDLDGLLLQIAVEHASAEVTSPDDRTRSLETLERIAKEAEDAGEYVTASRALHNLSLHQPPDVADATLDAMGAVAERGGFDLASALLLPVRKADVAVARADLKAAQQWIDRARPFVHHLKSGKHIRFHETLIRQETGVDVDPEMLDGLSTASAWTWSVRLRQAAQQGRVDDAVQLLASPPVDDSFAFMGLAIALSDLSAAGIDPALVGDARDAIVDAGEQQSGWALASALVAERVGDPDAGDLLAELGVDEMASEPSHETKTFGALLAAEVHLAQARLAAGAGRHDERRRLAHVAAELLARWPGRRRDEALALAADDVCSDELTGREIDVARLVARGMTNGQIADELFIARKTVSTHVSHILTKLGMTSRTEIATWAVRSGLDPT